MKRSLTILFLLHSWAFLLSAEHTSATSAILLPSQRMSGIGSAVDVTMGDSITYIADHMFYDVVFSRANLTGDVSIMSEGSILRTDTITLDLKTNIMASRGATYIKDVSGCMIANDVWINPKKEWALFNKAAGKLDVGYYYGSQTRQVKNGVYDVDNGMFTTCDAPEHHFDIYAVQMRLYRGNMVVMKPVVILVNHFPVIALPSYSFSIARGKQNGFLMPTPGRNSNDGKFVENIGYYLFFEDYWDAVAIMNVREKTGIDGEFITRYKKRYEYEGILEINQKRAVSNAGKTTNYAGEYHYNHKQDFNDGSALSADLNYYSSKEILEDEEDIDTRTNENIKSTISYSKPFLSSTLLMSSEYSQDMNTKAQAITLPYVSYTLTSRPIWEMFLDEIDEDENPWWKDFSYSFKTQATQSGTMADRSAGVADVLWKSKKDSAGTLVNTHKAGAWIDLGLTHSRKVLSWLTFSQSVPFKVAYSSNEINYASFDPSYQYNYSNSLGFSVVGFKNFGEFFFKGIRHIIDVSGSFAYVPTIENKATGPYALGATTESKVSKLNFSNAWDLKLNPPGKNDKFLLNSIVTATTAYTVYSNDKSAEGKWDDIVWAASFDGQNLVPAGVLANKILEWTYLSHWFSCSVSNSNTASATQDPYNWELKEWSYKVPVSNTVGFALSQTRKLRYFNYSPAKFNQFELNKFFNNGPPAKRQNYIEQDNGVSVNVNYAYNFVGSQKKGEDFTKVEDYTLDLTGSSKLHLSKTWHLDYSLSYNIKEDDLGAQTFSAVKSLHCWNFSFSYTKEGAYWEYAFSFVNIKLPNDLKYEDDSNSNDD